MTFALRCLLLVGVGWSGVAVWGQEAKGDLLEARKPGCSFEIAVSYDTEGVVRGRAKVIQKGAVLEEFDFVGPVVRVCDPPKGVFDLELEGGDFTPVRLSHVNFRGWGTTRLGVVVQRHFQASALGFGVNGYPVSACGLMVKVVGKRRSEEKVMKLPEANVFHGNERIDLDEFGRGYLILRSGRLVELQVRAVGYAEKRVAVRCEGNFPLDHVETIVLEQ